MAAPTRNGWANELTSLKFCTLPLTTPLKGDLTLDRSGRVSKKFFSIMVGLLLGTGSFPQELNRPEDQPYDLKVPVELVLVPVTVQDKDGKLIYGLQKEDFKVYEEGMPERITYFSVEPSPLSVAVLVDRTIDHRTQEIFGQNMLALIEAFSAFDEIAFYEFLDTTQRLQDFTSNKEALLKVFARMQFVPAVIWESNWVNTTSLDSAISTAAHDLQRRGKNQRKSLTEESLFELSAESPSPMSEIGTVIISFLAPSLIFPTQPL
jgi:hypothetical protein